MDNVIQSSTENTTPACLNSPEIDYPEWYKYASTIKPGLARAIKTITDTITPFCVSFEDVRSGHRNCSIVMIRFILAFRLREQGLVLTEIGHIMNRNHSTIIHYLKQYNNLLTINDKAFAKALAQTNQYIA